MKPSAAYHIINCQRIPRTLYKVGMVVFSMVDAPVECISVLLDHTFYYCDMYDPAAERRMGERGGSGSLEALRSLTG
jgi:hypothetical protein